MARISVEQTALTDSRFSHLGLALGAEKAPGPFGLGIMVYIWNECQERERYELQRVAVKALGVQLGVDRLDEAVEATGLAEAKGRNWLRIKGTEGRIEWIAEQRDKNRERQRKHRELKLASRVTNALVTGRSRGSPALAPALTASGVSLPPEDLKNDPPTEAHLEARKTRSRIVHAPPGRVEPSQLVNGERHKWLEDAFRKVYAYYPRHVGKDLAWRAFLKLDPDESVLHHICVDVERRVHSGEWQPDGRMEFIPHMSTYLNQRRWEDGDANEAH